MVLEAKRFGIALMLALFVAALPVTVSFAYTYQSPQTGYQLYQCYDYSYGSYYSYTPCPSYVQPTYQPTYYYPTYDYWYYQPQTYYDYSYYYPYNPYYYSYATYSNVNINNGGYYGW